MLKSIHAL